MLGAVGRTAVAELAITVVVDASVAVGVYRRFEIVMVAFNAAMGVTAAHTVTAHVARTLTASHTVAATAVTMRGGELRAAQTKHDCERKNCNWFYDVHDLLLLNE